MRPVLQCVRFTVKIEKPLTVSQLTLIPENMQAQHAHYFNLQHFATDFKLKPKKNTLHTSRFVSKNGNSARIERILIARTVGRPEQNRRATCGGPPRETLPQKTLHLLFTQRRLHHLLVSRAVDATGRGYSLRQQYEYN